MSRARREADGNVSALVDTLVQKVRLEESVRVEAAWYTAHPGFEEAAEAERYGDA